MTAFTDHVPTTDDGLPTTSWSEADIAAKAAAARRCLARHGAMDVAEALGIGEAA